MDEPWFKPTIPNPPDLAAEPEADKALRFLRNLREFVESEHGVTAVQLDGQVIMLVKYNGQTPQEPVPDIIG